MMTNSNNILIPTVRETHFLVRATPTGKEVAISKSTVAIVAINMLTEKAFRLHTWEHSKTKGITKSK